LVHFSITHILTGNELSFNYFPSEHYELIMVKGPSLCYYEGLIEVKNMVKSPSSMFWWAYLGKIHDVKPFIVLWWAYSDEKHNEKPFIDFYEGAIKTIKPSLW